MKSLSHVRLFATLCIIASQAPLPRGYSRQEYWSGLPFPSPGDLPDPGVEARSPAGRLSTTWASREALILQMLLCILDIQFRLCLLLTLLLNSIPSAHPDHFSRKPTYAYQSFIGSRRKREPISLSPTHDLF